MEIGQLSLQRQNYLLGALYAVTLPTVSPKVNPCLVAASARWAVESWVVPVGKNAILSWHDGPPIRLEDHVVAVL